MALVLGKGLPVLQITYDSLPTHHMLFTSLCLTLCAITCHMGGSICQRRGPQLREYRLSSLVPAARLGQKQTDDSVPQSLGVQCLSKVPSIWREPPSLPVTNSTRQAMTRGLGPARQEMLRVLCLFRQSEPKLCAADFFFTSLRTTKDLMYVMVLPMPCPAVPIGRFEALSGGRCPRGAEKCRTMRPVLLAIRPQAAGTVGCDCEILWARPRRLTLGLQRLHCNVLLWDVPVCRNRTLAPARKQRARGFLFWPPGRAWLLSTYDLVGLVVLLSVSRAAER